MRRRAVRGRSRHVVAARPTQSRVLPDDARQPGRPARRGMRFILGPRCQSPRVLRRLRSGRVAVVVASRSTLRYVGRGARHADGVRCRCRLVADCRARCPGTSTRNGVRSAPRWRPTSSRGSATPSTRNNFTTRSRTSRSGTKPVGCGEAYIGTAFNSGSRRKCGFASSATVIGAKRPRGSRSRSHRPIGPRSKDVRSRRTNGSKSNRGWKRAFGINPRRAAEAMRARPKPCSRCPATGLAATISSFGHTTSAAARGMRFTNWASAPPNWPRFGGLKQFSPTRTSRDPNRPARRAPGRDRLQLEGRLREDRRGRTRHGPLVPNRRPEGRPEGPRRGVGRPGGQPVRRPRQEHGRRGTRPRTAANARKPSSPSGRPRTRPRKSSSRPARGFMSASPPRTRRGR